MAEQLATPTGFSVSSREATSIALSWTAVENASSYEIVRCDSAGSTTYATNTATEKTTSFTGLSEGTTYYFKIKAVGDGTDYSDSAYSSVVSAKTQTTLAAPTLSMDSRTAMSVTLTRTEVSNASSYEIQRVSSGGGTVYTTNTTTTSTTTTTFSSLSNNTLYYFRARAVGSGDYATSAWSSIFQVRTLTPLDAPTVTLSGVTPHTIDVSWTSVANVSSYIVCLDEEVKARGLTSTSTTLTDVAAKAKHSVFVLAVAPTPSSTPTADGYATTRSLTQYVTTPAPSQKLATPEVELVATTNTSITAKPKTLISGATKYYLQYKQSTASSWATSSASTAADGTIKVTGLSNTLADYKIRICASDGLQDYDDSDYSAPITFEKPGVLAAPTLSYVNKGAYWVELSWNAVKYADGYRIGAGTSTSFSTPLETTDIDGSQTSAVIPYGNLGNTNSYWKIKTLAKSGYTDSAYSSALGPISVMSEIPTPPTIKFNRIDDNGNVVVNLTPFNNGSVTFGAQIALSVNDNEHYVLGTPDDYSGEIVLSEFDYNSATQVYIKARSYKTPAQRTTTQTGWADSDWSSEIQVYLVPTPIDTPTAVIAKILGARVFVEPLEIEASAAGYTLQYKKSTDSEWTTSDLSLNYDNQFVVKELDEHTNYQFRIKANGSSAYILDSDWSDAVTATTGAAMTPLPTPTAVLVSQTTGSSAVKIGVKELIPGATKYGIQYKLKTETYWTLGSTSTTGEFAITGLTQWSEYQFRINASDDETNYYDSDYSEPVTAETGGTPVTLATVAKPSFVNKGTYWVQLSWTKVANASGYRIVGGTSSSATSFVVDESFGDVNTAVVPVPNAQTRYYYGVQALGDGKKYLNSTIGSGTTYRLSVYTGRLITTAPTIVKKSATLDTIVLTITKSGSYATQIAYSYDNGATWTEMAPGVYTTGTSWTLASIPSTISQVKFKARAYNTASRSVSSSTVYCESAWSSVLTVEKPAIQPLDRPTGLAVSNITSTGARISWNAVANAVGYKVEYRVRGATAWLEATE